VFCYTPRKAAQLQIPVDCVLRTVADYTLKGDCFEKIDSILKNLAVDVCSAPALHEVNL
jgi:hypothetical protein